MTSTIGYSGKPVSAFVSDVGRDVGSMLTLPPVPLIVTFSSLMTSCSG